MGQKKTAKKDLLEDSIYRAMELLDGQVAREMQRTPAELHDEGVQKWQPYEKRVELVATMILRGLGEQKVELDSLIILSRAMTKALYLFVDELGKEGLGKLRSSYCTATSSEIEADMRRIHAALEAEQRLVS